MDESRFWALVQQSLNNTSSQEEQAEYLENQLEKLPPEEIIGFRLRTDKLLYETYTPEMWCAAYIMNGGCSDDGFEYFRNWIISRGKTVFYDAKSNPDSLISEVHEDMEYYDFEDFWYVALKAFEARTGKDLYDFISDDFTFNEANYPEIDFNWEDGNPESLKRICPQLFEKMWND